MRKELALVAMVATLFTFATFSTQAMPAASLKGLSKSGPTITEVRARCGRGWHRNWRGRCVPNRWWHRPW